MKRFLRSFFIHILVVWFVANNFGGISYQNNIQYLALGALALTLADSLLKPLINLLLLPFNLVTLGLFRWVSGVITLYVATTLVRGFSIVAFTYPGFQSNMFIIPAMTFSAFAAFIVVSFVISVISSFLFWVSK
ncbi:MAG: phage holin family protein [Candidatus Blackburnbacteria bacterium]|nr:phage holin family protein [Candidatus Blackburnbacteria bacterium]